MLALTDGPILLLVCCDLAAVGCGTHNRLIQLRIVRKRKTHLNGSFILTMPKMILESLTIKKLTVRRKTYSVVLPLCDILKPLGGDVGSPRNQVRLNGLAELLREGERGEEDDQAFEG